MTARTITAADLRAMYEIHTGFAERWIESHSEDMPPLLFAAEMTDAVDDGPTGVVMIDPKMAAFFHSFEDGRGKELMADIIRDMLQKLGPGAVIVHMSEAWQVTEHCDDMTPPSQRADRQEVLMIGLHTLERTYIGGQRIVTSAGKRKLVREPLVIDGEVRGTLATGLSDGCRVVN